MTSTQQLTALKALAKIEGFKNDLNMLGSTLGNLSLWHPATPHKKQCDLAIQMIDNIAERFERKLVVTIVGPCGAGKSTLLNALAGVDDLSPAGHQRPTTGQVIVFSSDDQDAGQLIEGLGSESVAVKSSPAAALLEHVLIIDTPDTDSMAYQKHSPLVREAIGRSDMLICVFDSENPKRKDHVDFLAPFIQRFNGESLVVVINKCDRQDELELKNQILPDFSAYIQDGWQTTVDRMLCISARSHLQNSRWDETAGPKHDFDQFDMLQQLIFDNINRAGYVVDRRLENARSLRDFVFNEVSREVSGHRKSLAAAAEQFRDAEKKSYLDAVAAMKNDDSHQLLGVSLMVYQKLAQRWIGPIGWMIAIWARLLLFGAGMAALFRFGRPVSQIIGLISAWRHYKDSKSAMADTSNDERVGAGLRTYRLATMSNWPNIAESMIGGGFDSTVRRVDDALPADNTFGEKFAGLWSSSLESEMERISRRLSGLPLQILFNLPALAILGYTGWITVQRFLMGSYLAFDFFVHALWTIGIVLLLSFFLFQVCVRLGASPERVTRRAFEKMKRQADQLEGITTNPVLEQLETVLELEAMLASRK
jgi:energy-coupling factor transporter ATP-binding protein EcfA2